MKLKTQWLLMALFAVLPYLVLGAAGAWWLYDSGWWLWWIGWAALVSLSGWPLMKWLRRRTALSNSFDAGSFDIGTTAAGPSQNWSPVGQAAWADVEAITRRLATEDIPLDRPEPLIDLAREVVAAVARQFHPRSKQPLFEIPVPHVLRIVELVVHDLREACSANIPGSHILTINDLLKVKKLVAAVPTFYRLYRLLGLVVNPLAALARELNILSQEQMLTGSTIDTKRWALQFAVRRTGFYAIDLYSGHLVLRGVEFDQYTTGQSRRAIASDQERTESLAREPLRILILGQVKAGKSSLINALFGELRPGETRAAVDVVPRTKSVEPYVLERDGLQRAIILDTAGYEDSTQTAAALDQARHEIEQSDLIVLVSSAQTAARDADRRLLDQVRNLFQQNPDRPFPPLVAALTHIDQLRPFREWNPPYNLAQPEGTKAQQIREAVETTAGELAVDIERVIPVCLREGNVYNVEEGLVPAILASLGDAERQKYLRCLREFKHEEYWRQLREQAANAGRILLKTGRKLLEGALRPGPGRDL